MALHSDLWRQVRRSALHALVSRHSGERRALSGTVEAMELGGILHAPPSFLQTIWQRDIDEVVAVSESIKK